MSLQDGSEKARHPRYLHLLQCPACGAALSLQGEAICCQGCGHCYQIRENIPLFFQPLDQDEKHGSVTENIRTFYESTPFPDYEGFEDLASLIEFARRGIFARMLDEQIPFGVRVLDCGCGTGQLSNYLGIAHRTVFGTDLALNSLRLAEDFRQRHQLDRVFFLQMNLFRPVLAPSSFDFVICNGVLHHTADPRRGFNSLASLVRPGGYLIVGLYHRFGRIATDLRRLVFHASGSRWRGLDPRIRSGALGQTRSEAWFADQYQNPHESKHTISEVLTWLDEAGLRFVRSIPHTGLFTEFTRQDQLFEENRPAGNIERWAKELSLLFTGDREGGFFTVIARKES